MPSLDSFTLDLNTLQAGDYQYHFTLDDAFFAQYEKSDILGGDIQTTVTLAVREQGCQLSVHAQGTVQLTCDRCLEPMVQPVDAHESLLVKIALTPQEDNEADDTIYVDPSEPLLDLAWLIYELIEINLPIVHSHQTGECNPLMEELLQAHLCHSQDEPEE